MDSRKFQIVMRLIDVVERVLIATPDAQIGADTPPQPMPAPPARPDTPYANDDIDNALTNAFNRILGDNAAVATDGLAMAEPPPTVTGEMPLARGDSPPPAVDFADDEVAIG